MFSLSKVLIITYNLRWREYMEIRDKQQSKTASRMAVKAQPSMLFFFYKKTELY